MFTVEVRKEKFGSSKIYKLALDGKPITINGTGKQTRDFIYIDDLVTLLNVVAKSQTLVGSFFR